MTENKTHHKQNKKTKTLYIVSIIIIALIIITGVYYLLPKSSTCTDDSCSVDTKENIVAEFNGHTLDSKNLDKFYDMTLFLQNIPKEDSSKIPKEKILNQTITLELLYLEAKKAGFNATKQEAEQLLKKELDSSGSDIETFKKSFVNKSFDYDYFIYYTRKNIAANKMFTELVFKDINVSEKDAKQYYDNNNAQFKQKEQIKASHILVNSSDEAKKIISMLDSGKDFAELAKEKSIGPSGSNGGDLGFFSKGMMVPEFEKAAFALNVGEYSKEPVKTQFGYHIILVTNKTESKTVPFEDIKEEIIQGISKQKKIDAMNQFIKNIIDQANIKTYLK